MHRECYPGVKRAVSEKSVFSDRSPAGEDSHRRLLGELEVGVPARDMGANASSRSGSVFARMELRMPCALRYSGIC